MPNEDEQLKSPNTSLAEHRARMHAAKDKKTEQLNALYKSIPFSKIKPDKFIYEKYGVKKYSISKNNISSWLKNKFITEEEADTLTAHLKELTPHGIDLWIYNKESKKGPIVEENILKRAESIVLTAINSPLLNNKKRALEELFKSFKKEIYNGDNSEVNFKKDYKNGLLKLKLLAESIIEIAIKEYIEKNSTKKNNQEKNDDTQLQETQTLTQFKRTILTQLTQEDESLPEYAVNDLFVINESQSTFDYYQRTTELTDEQYKREEIRLKSSNKEMSRENHNSAHRGDAYGTRNKIICFQGQKQPDKPLVVDNIFMRHGSIMPINYYKTKSKKDVARRRLRAQAMLNAKEIIRDQAQFSAIGVGKLSQHNNENNPLPVYWANMQLISPGQLFKAQAQGKQFEDTILAFFRLNGSKIEVEVKDQDGNLQKIWVQPHMSFMNMGVNTWRSFITEEQKAVNKCGLLDYYPLFQAGINSFSATNLDDPLFTKVNKLNTKYKNIENTFFEENEKHINKYDELKNELSEILISYEKNLLIIDYMLLDNPKADVSKRMQALKELEERIENTKKQLYTVADFLYNQRQQLFENTKASFNRLLNATEGFLSENKKNLLDKLNSEKNCPLDQRPYTDLVNQVAAHRYFTDMQELAYTDKWLMRKYNFTFQSRFTALASLFDIVPSANCKSNNDRTPIAIIYMQANQKFQQDNLVAPSVINASDRRKVDDYAKDYYTGSASMLSATTDTRGGTAKARVPGINKFPNYKDNQRMGKLAPHELNFFKKAISKFFKIFKKILHQEYEPKFQPASDATSTFQTMEATSGNKAIPPFSPSESHNDDLTQQPISTPAVITANSETVGLQENNTVKENNNDEKRISFGQKNIH